MLTVSEAKRIWHGGGRSLPQGGRACEERSDEDRGNAVPRRLSTVTYSQVVFCVRAFPWQLNTIKIIRGLWKTLESGMNNS